MDSPKDIDVTFDFRSDTPPGRDPDALGSEAQQALAAEGGAKTEMSHNRVGRGGWSAVVRQPKKDVGHAIAFKIRDATPDDVEAPAGERDR